MLLTNFPNYPFLWQNELELKHFSTTEKGQKVGTHPQSICILGQDMTKWVIFAEVTPFDRNLIPTELSITSTENITTPNTLILIIMCELYIAPHSTVLFWDALQENQQIKSFNELLKHVDTTELKNRQN